jgi:hypothetical protein
MEATQQNPARSSLMVWPLPVQPLSSSNVLITAFTHTHARARAHANTLVFYLRRAPQRRRQVRAQLRQGLGGVHEARALRLHPGRDLERRLARLGGAHPRSAARAAVPGRVPVYPKCNVQRRGAGRPPQTVPRGPAGDLTAC